jgi:hypothetical protein
MPDDLDERIRAAMKVLDGETPSGYFDAAPNQILARLEDGSMQHGTGTSTIGNKRDMASALMGAPVTAEDADTNPTPRVEASDVGPLPTKPVAKQVEAAPADAPAPLAAKKERDEDSGLHDIRNLAQSTKQRLSAKRITQNPPNRDDDVLASSSGSFAGIALPQPAKMVALPELEDLPSKQEIIAAQKAAAKARKEKKPTIEPKLESRDSGVLAPQATANAALAAMSAAPIAAAADAPAASSSSAVPVRQAFTLPSMERKSNKGPLIAILGLGVAAAAGGLIYMSTQGDEKKAAQVAASDQAPAQAKAEPALAAAPVAAAGSAAPVEATPPAPPLPPEEEQAAAPAVAESDDDAKDDGKADKVGRRRGAKASGGAAKKTGDDEKQEEPKKEEAPKDPPKEIKTPEGTKKANTGEGEPSFDALLKEAGVEDKKEVKPKLEKKSLSGDDFKKGMSSVQAKAQGCYKGTQGTASVKLTVSPDGKVKSVTVGGQFAGKPEGSCVEAAVKGASFPAWDGGPQSFNYSYMLSD